MASQGPSLSTKNESSDRSDDPRDDIVDRKCGSRVVLRWEEVGSGQCIFSVNSHDACDGSLDKRCGYGVVFQTEFLRRAVNRGGSAGTTFDIIK